MGDITPFYLVQELDPLTELASKLPNSRCRNYQCELCTGAPNWRILCLARDCESGSSASAIAQLPLSESDTLDATAGTRNQRHTTEMEKIIMFEILEWVSTLSAVLGI